MAREKPFASIDRCQHCLSPPVKRQGITTIIRSFYHLLQLPRLTQQSSTLPDFIEAA
jgi:hypothetical protein